MLGFITGNSRGVSTVPLLVFSLPILPSKSFSLISKLKVKPKQDAVLPYKKVSLRLRKIEYLMKIF